MQHLTSLVALGFAVGAVLAAQSDLFEWSLYAPLEAGQRVVAIAFSPDGLRGAFATVGGAVQVFELTSRPKSFRKLAQQKAQIVSLRFVDDGSDLMSAGEDGTVLISPIAGTTGRTISAEGKLVAAAISKDGTLLATATEDRKVLVWDIPSGRPLGQFQHKSKRPFFALGFAERDTSLIGVSQSGTICQWDVKTRSVLRQMQDSDQAIHSASISDGGDLLAIGTESADFQKGGFGQVSPGRAGMPGLGPGGRGQTLGGGPIISGTARPTDIYRENRIKIYDLGRGSVAKTLGGITGDVVALALSSDGRFVGFTRQAIKDSFLVVYDTRRGVEVASTPLTVAGTAVAFSHQGQWLGATTDRGDILAWAVKGITTDVGPGDLRGVIYTITSSNNTPLIGPSQALAVAVMDFDANGLDTGTGRTVSDMVRTRIVEGQNVRIVERAEMDRVIKEQNFQFSDRVNPATAVSLGRMLGAGKIVFGSVSKLDTRLTINVRSVDVETGVLDGEREITCEPCGVSGLQEAIMRLKRVLVR